MTEPTQHSKDRKVISADATTMAVVNMTVTRCLIRELLASGQLDAQRMQSVFDAACDELAHSTASLSTADAQTLLGVFWPGYAAVSGKADLN